MNKSEGKELAREAGVTWNPDQFLGTPGSVILNIDGMRNRYRILKAYERSILWACKLLKEANIFSYEKVLIRAICTSIFETKINEFSLIRSINHLKENRFVTVSSSPKIDVYDPILELVVDDYEPVDYLGDLLSLLSELKDAGSLFYLGNAFYRDKEYENGEKSYKECLRISPESTVAHINLGLLFKVMGREEEAEAEYREALRINSDYALAHNNLGNLLYYLGRKEDAEKEYREAIRINPNFTEAHINLGVLLNNVGRKEAAKREYREAIRIKPDDAEAHANLGILYSKTGRNKEAKKELAIAKRLFDEQGREADVKKAEELLKSLK